MSYIQALTGKRPTCIHDLPGEILLYIASPRCDLVRKEIQAFNVALGLTFSMNMHRISKGLRSKHTCSEEEIRKLAFTTYCNFYTLKRSLTRGVSHDVLKTAHPELAFTLIKLFLPSKARIKFPKCFVCGHRKKPHDYEWSNIECGCMIHNGCIEVARHHRMFEEHDVVCPRWKVMKDRRLASCDVLFFVLNYQPKPGFIKYTIKEK